ANKLKLRLNECEVEVEAVDGSKIKPIGITDTVSFKVYNRIFLLQFYVLPIEACDLLLGLDWFYVSKACVNVCENKISFPETNASDKRLITSYINNNENEVVD
ncbi:MAG: retropepsin-like aspartic protease, partial [bacterium]